MKVCSLIDKHPDAEDSLPSSSMANSEKTHTKEPDSSSLLSVIQPSTQPKTPRDIKQSLHISQQKNYTDMNENSHSPDGPDSAGSNVVPESVAISLLGPGVKGFPMTSSMFEEAIRLRLQQEKTEQERLRLEQVSKTKSILEFAIHNNIPPESLALFSPKGRSEVDSVALPSSTQAGRYPFTGNLQAVAPVEAEGGSFQRSPYLSASPSQHRLYENSNNASTVDPMNFRFGGPSRFNQQPPHNAMSRRSRSPAKLGAIAVANLANPITPYRPTNRTIPLHQRHYSMPTETSTSSQTADRHYSRARYHQGTHMSNSLKSPLGGASSMQVRPLPAQPLHKQTKRGQSLSQDAITQHQQVIQFHHWISENPGEKPPERVEHRRNNSASSQSSISTSHKRYKSADMSVDLSQVEAMSDLKSHPNHSFHVSELRKE